MLKFGIKFYNKCRENNSMITDALQKEIDRLRDEKNHLWGTMVIVLGSSITLLLTVSFHKLLKFSMFDLFKSSLCMLGFYLSYLFFNGYFNKNSEIKRVIKKLEKET